MNYFKYALLFFVYVVIVVVFNVLFILKVIPDQLLNYEITRVEKNLKRANQFIILESERIATLTQDWSLWDESYEYARGKNPGFKEDYLIEDQLLNNDLDFIAYFDTEGLMIDKVISKKPSGLSSIPAEITAHSEESPAHFKIIHDTNASRSPLTGLLRTTYGTLFFSAYPILNNDGTGASAGTIVMGEFLSLEHSERAEELFGLNIKYIENVNLPSDVQTIARRSLDNTGLYIYVMDNQTLVGYEKVTDIMGTPSMFIELKYSRDLSLFVTQNFKIISVAIALANTVIAFAFLFIMRQSCEFESKKTHAKASS